jgi:hypothetical protein
MSNINSRLHKIDFYQIYSHFEWVRIPEKVSYYEHGMGSNQWAYE